MYYIIDAKWLVHSFVKLIRGSVLGVFVIESKRSSNSQDEELKLLSITTKDVCDNDIVSDFCLVKLGDIVKSFTKERLDKNNKDFFAPMLCSTTLATRQQE